VEILTKAPGKDSVETKGKDSVETKGKDSVEIKGKDSVEIKGKDLEVTKGSMAMEDLMEGKDLIITLIQIIIMYQILPNLNQVFQQILILLTLTKVLPIFTKDQHTIIQLKSLKTLN
jgi:hypothetical protein